MEWGQYFWGSDKDKITFVVWYFKAPPDTPNGVFYWPLGPMVLWDIIQNLNIWPCDHIV